MTSDRRQRPLLAGVSAAIGVLAGGLLGILIGFWLSSQFADSSQFDNAFSQVLEAFGRAIPYLWAGALLGALLGWIAAPLVVGLIAKWPKVWLALGVQVVTGIASWLAVAFLATVLDVGVIGAWLFVALVILGPPAAGRRFVERDQSQPTPTDDVPQPGSEASP